jgi:hypothetical protein
MAETFWELNTELLQDNGTYQKIQNIMERMETNRRSVCPHNMLGGGGALLEKKYGLPSQDMETTSTEAKILI